MVNGDGGVTEKKTKEKGQWVRWGGGLGVADDLSQALSLRDDMMDTSRSERGTNECGIELSVVAGLPSARNLNVELDDAFLDASM
ncbi:hypothetical protein MTR67_008762 [Solanum verrucosum]|uniref:Uncharacterized protein n=1 Tax=Solanum verrucosum TaxID=315347 RepID=A0AAF0Q2W4_SOLVR|nr:hypothetical protein MTR67_008762 [Solanum verrucosum]